MLLQTQSFISEINFSQKLFIIPAYCHTLGGTTVSLSMLAKGFALCGKSDNLCVLVHQNSFMEEFFHRAGQSNFIQPIPAKNSTEFLKLALQWVAKQPSDCPLLLDNCVLKSYLPILLSAAPSLRLSGRKVYHFCHDLALSHNHFGNIARKITFAVLAPSAICNSEYTAKHIRDLIADIRGILYQPVDLELFNPQTFNDVPPELQAIRNTGARVMLTPSRLNKPHIVNDKNLRQLIPILAELKAMGHFYHGVVIGEDPSPNHCHTEALVELAHQNGVADRFTVLPPSLDIAQYYKYADVVVTMAPREPFGRTVVEAIASGVPVIGSNTGGVNEILQNFAPQWTVDSNDAVAAAKTIVQTLMAIDTQEVLAKGRCWVEENCSVESYARGMMRLVEG